ncbi:MAG: AI-2E family transporter [Leptolyngbyaceae bacterium]|nr:AI-2E family transporter [Leptolyngbyaceae bacterium]
MTFGKWIGLICVVISFIILWQIRQTLLLIFLAVVVATALNGITRFFMRTGVRHRPVAVLLTITSVALVSTVFVALVIPPFVDQFRSLIQRLPLGMTQVAPRVEYFVENLPSWFPDVTLELPDITAISQQLQPLVQNLIQNFFDVFNTSLGFVLKILLVFALTMMILGDPMAYRRGFVRLFPSSYRKRCDEILSKCEMALGNWVGGIFINSLFVAMSSGIGLRILGVDLVLAHALLAGILNFIPNIGPVLSVIFPLSIALLEPPFWKAIAVVILYVVIQNVESYGVSPLVMAKQVALLPALTLSAQVFFTTFFGILGLILALPLTVVAKTWIEEALICDVLDRCGDPKSTMIEGENHRSEDPMENPTNKTLEGQVSQDERTV